MSGLVWGCLAATGVHLLWPRATPRAHHRRAHRPPIARWRAMALPVGTGLVGALVGVVVIGGPAGATVGLLTAGCAGLGRRSIGDARVEQARRAWPALLEEIRVLATTGGRSLPRALLEAGTKAPEPLAAAFRAAEQAWLVSADFERTLAILKDRVGEASTDLVCETLLVAHQVGGTSTGRRLARVAEDRRRDLDARDLAQAKLAGARFARGFVIIVPVGMALAGQAVGTGRDAFASPGGQLVGAVAAGLVAACWLWAGHLLRLPAEARVFP